MLAKIRTEWQKWATITPKNALYDRTLIWLFLGLLMIGFVMVCSASISVFSNEPFHFAIRDGGYVIAAIIMCVLVVQIPSERWQEFNVHLFFIALLLLLAIYFSGFGVVVNGSKRWLNLGIVNFQPAELAKLAIICYFSGFYVRRFEEMRNDKWAFWKPSVVLTLFCVLLYFQPDLGSIFVLCVLTFSMLFIMGARLVQFIVLGGIGIVLFSIFVLIADYRLRRVSSFMNPFADAYGDGYQLASSQMAFGLGELFGCGLGNSIQKLGYLPEAHTDFVMAIIAEEFGFVGIIFVMLLLLLLAMRAFKISKESLIKEQRFKGFLAFGIGIWIFLQGFVNLGVASGLLPTKGLTFPLVSYGGSSLVIMAIAVGILIRIDYENRLERMGLVHLNSDEQK